jgi:predicted 3-demethylubiquinone-9 3-methyltransferase (glyoxalase superfamily)
MQKVAPFLTFQIEGQAFYALNGGPMFTFTPAISMS